MRGGKMHKTASCSFMGMSSFSGKRLRTVSLVVGFFGALFGTGTADAGGTVYPVVSENRAPPTTKLVEAALLSPSDASAYYGSATLHTVGVTGAGKDAPEIKTLAASLLGKRQVSVPADRTAFVQNVFNYVRNNIDTEFRYGLSKGALGTLSDQSGTPFDQADLMVSLLAAGGVTASYQVGTITVAPQQFGQWSGLVQTLDQSSQNVTVSATAACRFLADGGIPAIIAGASDCAGLTGTLGSSVTFSHIWVDVGSIAYDPSYKLYSLKTGIDIGAAMQCGAGTCGDQIKSALSGTIGTEQGITYLSSYNLSAALTAVSQDATNLVSTIKSVNPDALVSEIVGGKELPPQGPLTAPSYSATATWNQVPDRYRTILSFDVAGVVGQYSHVCDAFFADEIGGRALRIDTIPRLDNDPISSLSYASADPTRTASCATDGGSMNNVPYTTITINHPYAANSGTYADETDNFKPVDDTFYETGAYRPFDLTNPYNIYNPTGTFFDDPNTFDPSDYPEKDFLGNGPVTIIHAFGQSRMSAERRAEEYKAAMDFYTSVCSPTTAARVQTSSCSNEEQVVLAERVNTYRTLSDRLVDGVTGATSTRHHDIGIIYGSRTPNLSRLTLQESLSVTSKTGNDTDRLAAFEVQAAVLSEIEGGTSPNENGVTMSFGTMFLGDRLSPMTGAFGSGGINTRRIYDITPTQMSAFLGILDSGVHADDNSATVKFQSCPTAPTACYRKQQLLDIANQGYSTIIAEGGEAEFFYKGSAERAYTVWEYMKGGSALADPLATATKTADIVDAAAARKKQVSISLADGAVRYQAEPDLVTGAGGFPQSLPFVRSFVPSSWERPHYGYMKYLVITGTQAGGGQYTADMTRLDSSSADAEYNDRLGGGWLHNYQVFLNVVHEPGTQLGAGFALDAALPISKIKAMFDLSKASDLKSRVAKMVVTEGLTASSDVVVKSGASSNIFHAIPGGQYFSHQNPGAQIIYNSTGCSDWWTCTIWTYVGSTGQRISFSRYYNTAQSWNPQNGTMYNEAPVGRWADLYKADNWSFPDGTTVAFHYTKVLLTPPGSQLWYPCSPLSFTYQNGSSGSVETGSTPGTFSVSTGSPCTTIAYLPVGMVLTSVENNLGRKLTFQVDRINTYGYSFKISKVTDENGRAVTFNYGGCPSFTCEYFTATGPNNLTTRYEYTSSTTSPDPSVRIRSGYVIRRWFTPGNPTTPFEEFTYNDLFQVKAAKDRNGHVSFYFSGTAGVGERWKRSESWTPAGKVSTTIFDEKDNQVVLTSPMGRTVLQTFDNGGHHLKVTLPEGNGVQNSYDVRGNIVQTRRFSKTCGSAATCSDDIVTRTTYLEGPTIGMCANAIICDKPASETDGRGNITNYSWDTATGNLNQVLKPAVLSATDNTSLRPQTDFAYTSFGGVYLLTGKTDKIDSTRSTTTAYEYDTSNHDVLKSVVVDPGGLNLRTCVKYDVVGNLISKTDAKSGLTVCP